MSSPVSPGPHQELRQSDSIIKEIKADDGGAQWRGVFPSLDNEVQTHRCAGKLG